MTRGQAALWGLLWCLATAFYAWAMVVPVLGQDVVWYNDHAKIYRPLHGFWAANDLYKEQGMYTLRVNLVLDKGWCMQVVGQRAFLIQLKNKRTKESIYVVDYGVRIREGSTQSGWKDTLIDNVPVLIAYNDDELLRRDAKMRHPEVNAPVPVRVLMYVRVEDAIGGGDAWNVITVCPLAVMTEVLKCAS